MSEGVFMQTSSNRNLWNAACCFPPILNPIFETLGNAVAVMQGSHMNSYHKDAIVWAVLVLK